MSCRRSARLRAAFIGFHLILLAGCTRDAADTSADHTRPEPSTSTTQATAPAAVAPLRFTGPSSRLLQDLWAPVQSLRPLRTSLPRRLDFAAIKQSPRLTEAPIDSAVLAVGVDPQAYSVGDPAVVTADGEWRMVERDVLGMRDPDIVEQQYELSPDGSTLALGDAFGVVFVDVATGTATRVSTRLQDPVLHMWTGESRGVIVTKRHSQVHANPAWEVSMAERTVTPVPFDPWSSAMGTDGRVAELVPAATDPRSSLSFTDVRTWRNGRLLTTRPLRVGVPQRATVAGVWSSQVGFRQDSSKKLGTAGGLGVLDPRTGQVPDFLHLPREQLAWVSVKGVIADRWLLLSVPSGPGGGIVAWDPVRQQLRAVTEIDVRAADVSLAGSRLP